MASGMNPFIVGSLHGDEYYTQRHHVVHIAENMNRISGKIWCPFDTDDSEFPKVLREYGFDVVNTHLPENDFFVTFPPDGVEAIVSNPPFSQKTRVLERCSGLGIPFCLVLPFMYLNNGVPLRYGNQLMFFDRRVAFWHNGKLLENPRVTAFVMSNGLLKRDLIYIDDRNRR